MAKIILIEDDQALSSTIADWLRFERHIVELCDKGAQGLDMLQCFEYDLVILDWEIPDLSGIEILKAFRASGGVTPVLMLTGRRTVSDKETGLDAGGDDYLTKPFELRELSARIRALLRRPQSLNANTLKVGPLELDPIAVKVTRDGEKIDLHPREFALLEFFMRHPNRVFNAEALIERVWTTDTEVSVEAIRTSLKRLRKQIDKGSEESLIKTVHGMGYKLED